MAPVTEIVEEIIVTEEIIDLHTAPLYLLTEDLFYDVDRRKFQVNDVNTAIYFWDKYQPEFVSVQQISPDFKPIPLSDIKNLLPDREWFLPAADELDVDHNLTHADTIHGVSHSFRVGIYAHILAQIEGLDDQQKNILLAAALVHDTQRKDDRVDPDHGKNAAEYWGDEERFDLLKSKGISLSNEEKEIVKLLCTFHEKPYQEALQQIKSQETLKLLRLFMVADALDRFRAPNERWWPDLQFFNDDDHLHHLMTKLIPFAIHFTLKTELYRLQNGLSHDETFSSVGRDVGLFEQGEKIESSGIGHEIIAA